jgi:hypothetical protein
MTSRTSLRAAMVVAAPLAALLVWVVAAPLLGVDMRVPTGPDRQTVQEIGPGPIVVVSVGSALAGWALIAVLERFTAKARLIWTVVAVAVLALSMFGPLANLGAYRGAAITLAIMHLVVGAVVIGVVRRTAAPAARPSTPGLVRNSGS